MSSAARFAIPARATLTAVHDPQVDEPPSAKVLVLAWLLVGGAVLWHGLAPLSDLDVWWHLRVGEQILSTGSLLPTDPFSHTQADAPWSWKDAGFAIALHWLWSAGGAAAIVVAKAAAFGVLAALLWRLLRHARSLPPSLAIAATALALEGTAYRFTERAASLSLLILTAVLVLIERDRQGSRGLPWVIGLAIVNANVHRGVVVLPVVMGVYALSCFVESRLGRETHAAAAWRRNALLALATAAACLATPFTTALFSTSQGLMGQHTALLTEWAPVSFDLVWHLTPGSLVVGAVVVAGGVLLAVRVRPLPLWDLALIAMALALGSNSMRHLPYLALLGIGPAARAIAEWPGWIRRVGGLLGIAAGAAIFAAAVSRPLPPPSLGLAPAHYPERGVAFVQGLPPEQRIRGNLFNEFGYGGYLIFHLWPEYRVFIDGRTDLVYPPEHVAAYLQAVIDPQAFAAEATRYDIQWVMLDNAPHARPRAHFDANPDWTLVHVSRRALIYVKTNGTNAALAKALGYRWLWPHDLDGSLARAVAAGRGRQATEELRRMVEADPDNLYAMAALARLSARIGVGPQG